DQSYRRHRFNVENPSKAKGKKPRRRSVTSHYFRVFTHRRRFTIQIIISYSLQRYL
ncbi:hypothetical protein Zm00014a_000245, partial [Zea mays]